MNIHGLKKLKFLRRKHREGEVVAQVAEHNSQVDDWCYPLQVLSRCRNIAKRDHWKTKIKIYILHRRLKYLNSRKSAHLDCAAQCTLKANSQSFHQVMLDQQMGRRDEKYPFLINLSEDVSS